MGQAIGFCVTDGSSNSLNVNNFPFPFLGAGYYLFDDLVSARAFDAMRKKPFHAIKVEYFFRDDKHIDFDVDSNAKAVYSAFKKIMEATVQSNRKIRFEYNFQLLGYLFQVYKETYGVDLISLTLRDRATLYRCIKSEIAVELNIALDSKRLHCATSSVGAHILTYSRIT